MALSCGAKVLKYCLFAFNLIFVIAGIVCLSVGIWLIADPHAIDTMATAFKDMQTQNPNMTTAADDLSRTPNGVRNLGIVLASGGGVILIIAFLGCCGAVKEWRPLLMLYALFLMIILAVEIASAIYASVNRNTVEHDFKSYMVGALKYYGGNDTNPNPMRTAWDIFMNNSDCCGVKADWLYERGFNRSLWRDEIKKHCLLLVTDVSVYYPPVCCGKGSQKSPPLVDLCPGYRACTRSHIAEQNPLGCYERLKTAMESKMAIVIGVGVGVGLIQVIGIIFALCLCRAISSQET